MEEESFENEEIATYLNQHYVAIKVDREVRPDIDDAYMSVVQMLTGSGGWPMTVWLTPGRQPFSGGTYFPPRQFLAMLQQLCQGFDAEPLHVAEQAGEITRRVQQMAQRPGGEGLPDAAVLQRAFDGFAATFDATNGGFGRAPKFPSPPDLEPLLRHHRHAVLAYYGVTEPGNFHGRNILHIAAPLPEVAPKLGIEPTRLRQLLDEARSKLYAVRARRVPPHKDTKILAGWNGLIISAFARAGAVLGDPGYVERARTAARFVLERMRVDGRLRRSFAGGAAHEDAFLDDYAYLAAGLLDLYEA